MGSPKLQPPRGFWCILKFENHCLMCIHVKDSPSIWSRCICVSHRFHQPWRCSGTIWGRGVALGSLRADVVYIVYIVYIRADFLFSASFSQGGNDMGVGEEYKRQSSVFISKANVKQLGSTTFPKVLSGISIWTLGPWLDIIWNEKKEPYL